MAKTMTTNKTANGTAGKPINPKASFTDRHGRTWQLEITFADSIRIKKDLAVDLNGLLKDKLGPLSDLLTDMEKLVNVVFALVESQAEAAGVTPEDFGGSLNGEALEAMSRAFYEALADWHPRAGKQLRDLAAKLNAVQVELDAKATADLAKLTPEAMVEILANRITPDAAAL